MRARVSKRTKEQLKALSERVGMTMSDLTRESLVKLLDGEIQLPVWQVETNAGVSLVIPYEQEEQLKSLSKSSGVPLDEIFRIAIRDVLANAQRLIERADSLATTQERIQQRQERLLDREEALMKRREAMLNGSVSLSEDDDEDPSPRPHKTNHH